MNNTRRERNMKFVLIDSYRFRIVLSCCCVIFVSNHYAFVYSYNIIGFGVVVLVVQWCGEQRVNYY